MMVANLKDTFKPLNKWTHREAYLPNIADSEVLNEVSQIQIVSLTLDFQTVEQVDSVAPGEPEPLPAEKIQAPRVTQAPLEFRVQAATTRVVSLFRVRRGSWTR
jgi:hypothetical protein